MTKDQRIGFLLIISGAMLIVQGIELHIRRTTGDAESNAAFYRNPGFAYKWDQALKMGVILTGRSK